ASFTPGDTADAAWTAGTAGTAGPGRPVQAWLGEAIEIKPATTATFERYPRSNLLIVSGEEYGHGLLLATLLSAAYQRSPAHVRFTIAEFTRPSSPFRGSSTRCGTCRTRCGSPTGGRPPTSWTTSPPTWRPGWRAPDPSTRPGPKGSPCRTGSSSSPGCTGGTSCW